ncbi:hypothetical protein H6P81_014613 [Aristolochia fimbriata]|uniref:Ribosomal protein S3 n=1 Tax=Aristolochia fimbriata TaxID=158543 RepID=A0AAV7E359_ARIFI|nr:hypothetical protein H6P81_014613 [Aristolochia fimbriata]
MEEPKKPKSIIDPHLMGSTEEKEERPSLPYQQKQHKRDRDPHSKDLSLTTGHNRLQIAKNVLSKGFKNLLSRSIFTYKSSFEPKEFKQLAVRRIHQFKLEQLYAFIGNVNKSIHAEHKYFHPIGKITISKLAGSRQLSSQNNSTRHIRGYPVRVSWKEPGEVFRGPVRAEHVALAFPEERGRAPDGEPDLRGINFAWRDSDHGEKLRTATKRTAVFRSFDNFFLHEFKKCCDINCFL